MNPAFEATATLAPSFAPRGDARPWRLAALAQRLLRPLARVPAELADRSTGLYNRAGLMGAANERLREALPGCAFAVIVLDFADLREICQIYGTPVARKVVGRIIRRLRSVAGWRGLVGRTGPTQFTVVLPAANEEKAMRRIQRGLGKPARIEFDAGESEIVIVPDILVEQSEAGTPVQDVYREICRELARRQKDERRRLNWLASERERHSRPMSLPPR